MKTTAPLSYAYRKVQLSLAKKKPNEQQPPQSVISKIKTITIYSISALNTFKKERICYYQKHTLQIKQARDMVNNMVHIF